MSINKHVNTFSGLFKGEVTPGQLARATGLSQRTCAKVLKDRRAHVRQETAQILCSWGLAYLGESGQIEDFFHPKNLVLIGPLPKTGVPRSTAPEVEPNICPYVGCRLETPRRTQCVHCERPLQMPTIVPATQG